MTLGQRIESLLKHIPELVNIICPFGDLYAYILSHRKNVLQPVIQVAYYGLKVLLLLPCSQSKSAMIACQHCHPSVHDGKHDKIHRITLTEREGWKIGRE